MIEVVSYPNNLTNWNSTSQPFYLELFGETQPLVNMEYAEVLPVKTQLTVKPIEEGKLETQQPVPIYEYWWTIGHPGHPRHQKSHWWNWFEQEDSDFWANLPDPAARVYLFFPINGGWRTKELAATVKYLAPFHQQKSFWNKTGDDWKLISPLLADASTIASVFPGAGSVVSTLNAIAKLQINNVPQTDGFEWSVGKVTFPSPELGVMQGVMWTLPKKMLIELGGRLTGSLALSFIPAHIQRNENISNCEPSFKALPILAHAVVYGQDRDYWVPSQREFIKLYVAPVASK